MLDEIESKTVHKDKESLDRGQRSKTMTQVKPVKYKSDFVEFSRDHSYGKGRASFT